jgi:ATP diphosphatase
MAQPTRKIADLLELMAMLRNPQKGCPWDLKQTFASIAPYTLEEAYEVADAAERGDMENLREELGDLLLQIVFFSQMASERENFNFDDVVEEIASKLIRRHPHIFADTKAQSAEEVKKIWDEIKTKEKTEKREDSGNLLADIPLAIPALTRALKIQEKAAFVGFDWNDPKAVLDKIREELNEFEAELAQNNKTAERNELGDILFALVNLARHRKIDPEQALRSTNEKFTRRFNLIENELKSQGRSPQAATLQEMEALWRKAKSAEVVLNS